MKYATGLQKLSGTRGADPAPRHRVIRTKDAAEESAPIAHIGSTVSISATNLIVSSHVHENTAYFSSLAQRAKNPAAGATREAALPFRKRIGVRYSGRAAVDATLRSFFAPRMRTGRWV